MSADLSRALVAVAWYTADAYERVRAISADPEIFHRTHADWLASAEDGVKQLEKQGARVLRVDIDPEQLAAWCRSQGMKIDAKARQMFAVAMAVGG